MYLKQAIMSVVLVVSLGCGPAKSNFFKDTWGIITDPLKLKHTSDTLSESVQRSLIQLESLEGVANSHVKDRLDQIKSIVEGAIGGSSQAISAAISEMNNLERKINEDAVNLLYRGQCLVEVVGTDQIQRSYADFMENLDKSEPSIRIFGIKIISLSAKKIDITDPDKAFFSLREAVFKRINTSVTDKTSAYEILSSYQNLARLARLTRCHYIDLPLSVVMTKEMNELNRLSIPWTEVVQLKH